MAQEQGMGALVLSGVMVPSTVSFEFLGTAQSPHVTPRLALSLPQMCCSPIFLQVERSQVASGRRVGRMGWRRKAFHRRLKRRYRCRGSACCEARSEACRGRAAPTRARPLCLDPCARLTNAAAL